MSDDAPTNPNSGKKDVLQAVDADVRRLAMGLVRSARFAALGVLAREDGVPLVSRVNLATDVAGHPVFLISTLSAHRQALERDRRASLLVGEPGKGDPLAHARMTIVGHAERIDDEPARARVRDRYLARHPKSELYVDFPDFSFWRLVPSRASLNGGFGKAYALAPADVLAAPDELEAFAAAEPGAIGRFNEDHRDIVDALAHRAGATTTGWRIATIDTRGVDLVRGDDILRVWLETPAPTADEVTAALIATVRARGSTPWP